MRPEPITTGPILSFLRVSTTITAMVDASSKGLTASQLADVLGHDNVHHHLTTPVEQERLQRKGSRRSAVYLSKNPKKRKAQEPTPRKRSGAHRAKAADITIQKLLAVIWRHDLTVDLATAEVAAGILSIERRPH